MFYLVPTQAMVTTISCSVSKLLSQYNLNNDGYTFEETYKKESGVFATYLMILTNIVWNISGSLHAYLHAHSLQAE